MTCAASILSTGSNVQNLLCSPPVACGGRVSDCEASPLRPATLANADMTWNKLNLLFLFTFFGLQKYFAQKYQIPDGTKKLRADMMNVQSLLI